MHIYMNIFTGSSSSNLKIFNEESDFFLIIVIFFNHSLADCFIHFLFNQFTGYSMSGSVLATWDWRIFHINNIKWGREERGESENNKNTNKGKVIMQYKIWSKYLWTKRLKEWRTWKLRWFNKFCIKH